ncbi:MAG: extracellular solute-binding protein [Alphaproteobacteria bacterium]|nr:extracellular solute-binding protein [Alphaproteobacteria bacterium]
MGMNRRTLMLGTLLAGLAAGAAAPAAAQRVEIQWWHAMGGVLGERVEELVKGFNDAQQKYTVVAVNKGNYDEVINGTIAAYRAKRQPHLVQIYERGFMTMLLSDAIVPVHALMKEKGYTVDWNDFIKPVASFYTYKGNLMTMPFNSSTPILWFNKDQFAKAGFDKPAETWQELEKQLYAIKAKGAAECGTALANDYFWSLIENYSAINDQPFATRANGFDGLDTEFVYNKTSVVQQVTRLKKWLDDGVLQLAGTGFSPQQLFATGKCATYISSTADHGAMERNATVPWSATFLPHEQGVTARNSTIGGATIWVLKGHKPEEYDAVAAFFAHLASPKVQVWWHKVTGYVPLTNAAYKVAKDEGYYVQNPTREIAVLQLSRGTPTANSMGFRFGNFTQTTFALRQEMEAVMTGKKTPQQALDDSVRRGNEILRQFEKLNAGKY